MYDVWFDSAVFLQKNPKQLAPTRLLIRNLPQADGNFIRSLRVNPLNFPGTGKSFLQYLQLEL